MYIVKNALRCIRRSKGRNVLIGIIILVIAVSACVGLSIKQAALSARKDAMENLSITATISLDRQSMMSEMGGRGEKPEDGNEGGRGNFDRDSFKNMMAGASSLSLDEYKTYATADSVKDFYYSTTVSVNGSNNFQPVSNESETEESKDNGGFEFGGGRGSMMGMGSQRDFQIIGYSGENAMLSFINGTAAISDGTVFEEGTSQLNCIISEELATYNGLNVDDTIIITNPDNEEESYTLTVVGIYTDSSANEGSFPMGGMTASDPVNQIYMSYNALKIITDASETANADEGGESDTNEEETAVSALSGSLSATYTFSDIAAYESFETQVRELGLNDSYTVSSQDLAAYENSLIPLETLSTMAGWFLVVILIIGAIILIVLNIFNVRERKYEIGVLTAMGMKKGKVALQFLTEIFTVTLMAVIIGAAVGAVSAVPVTNALLENQISAQSSQADRIEANFGRGEMPSGNKGGNPPSMPGNDRTGMGDRLQHIFGQEGAEYITEINSAMNFTVVLQMFGIALLLTITSGMVSMLFIMRYEPLKILANRD